MITYGTIDTCVGKAKTILSGTYKGLDARIVLGDCQKMSGVGVDTLILSALLHNTKDEYLQVELFEFVKHSDSSGHYHVKIFHGEFPEGFEAEINTKYDLKMNIHQWAYGG